MLSYHCIQITATAKCFLILVSGSDPEQGGAPHLWLRLHALSIHKPKGPFLWFYAIIYSDFNQYLLNRVYIFYPFKESAVQFKPLGLQGFNEIEAKNGLCSCRAFIMSSRGNLLQMKLELGSCISKAAGAAQGYCKLKFDTDPVCTTLLKSHD